ncbi:2-hydroxychromene-2-carboxylate isomerase [Oceanicoccus sagamiensis]|uniref:2-hydroxychromene-2-carboxylate isomerase n=2 Tax=Oceanicoccus sagamiensis TaxID=716816 RepID=A0A1X9NRL5_9GAMM|nr:2-hydroxychromene-2-carboxylate isomerase [Oceanicoccus sagamiensis]
MDPGFFRRWVTSKVMRLMSSPERMVKKRAKAEQLRRKQNLPHIVEYFHQVDDAYSHLAAQLLKPLLARYNIEVVCHLVTGPVGDNVAEPDLLLKLAQYDAALVAPEYHLDFPQQSRLPTTEQVKLAESILAAQQQDTLLESLVEVGQALWSCDCSALNQLAETLGSASDALTAEKIKAGSQRQQTLQHYSGAMFYYGGEWYWGVDRLYHLEQRLAELQCDNHSGQPLLMPRPPIEVGEKKDNGSLTLEIYPSLRSPYTAMVFDRTVQLAKDTGVNLVIRPVIPMVMRGVPATKEKGLYILFDTAREARAAAVPFGNIYDPIGEPVRRAYSLYPWACEQGKGIDFISAFLKAAFTERVNTNNDKGLRYVVEQAGLSWEQAKPQIGDTAWQSLLEDNRQAMYGMGLWGVPSYRLLDKHGEQVLALWGQDRLWLFARAIKRLIEKG